MRFVMPEVVTTQFHLREGEKVADFGAGRGFFLKPLAEAVGKEGEVYLCEIQKNLVEFVGEQARMGDYSQVKPMWCDLEEAGGIDMSDGLLDTGILVNTLFQIEDKEVAVKEMVRTIRTGGKLIVVDWSDTSPGVGPSVDKIISATDCTTLLEANGCVFERGFPAGEHHYGLAFRKI